MPNQFDSNFYAATQPEAAANPSLHFLTVGWREGLAPNLDNQALSPDEILQMIVESGPELTRVVAGLNRVQLDYLDQAENFDLGTTLSGLDIGLLAGFMAGWGKEELAYLDALQTFDLSNTIGKFNPEAFLALLHSWDGDANLRYLTGINSLDFGKLEGANPDTALTFINGLHPDLQAAIYQDFGASTYAWLDGATNFDLAETMKTNFSFFSQSMPADAALGLFSHLGEKLFDVAQELTTADLQFLDSSTSFDLGQFLSDSDNTSLGNLMKGWGLDEVAYLNTLPSLNLPAKIASFNYENLADMVSGWNDPNILYFLNDLEGTGFGNKLAQLPTNIISGLSQSLSEDMLVALQGISSITDLVMGAG